MAFLGMESERGNQVGTAVHSSLCSYEHMDENPGTIQEECDNLFNE